MKYCPKCRIEKNLKEFSKSKNRKDKLNCWCKDCSNISHKNYHRTHKKEEKEYRIKNREYLLKGKKEYYIKFKEKHLKIGKIYRQTHKKEIASYFKNLRKTNINYKISQNLRNRIGHVLKGNPKLETTMKLAGCSIEQLKKHLENKFTKGMSWNNYGKWHIDHIKPCVLFSLSKASEQKKCFHYTNLQPLWAKDNFSKGTKIQEG